jgi:hypothetical protein
MLLMLLAAARRVWTSGWRALSVIELPGHTRCLVHALYHQAMQAATDNTRPLNERRALKKMAEQALQNFSMHPEQVGQSD